MSLTAGVPLSKTVGCKAGLVNVGFNGRLHREGVRATGSERPGPPGGRVVVVVVAVAMAAVAAVAAVGEGVGVVVGVGVVEVHLIVEV